MTRLFRLGTAVLVCTVLMACAPKKQSTQTIEQNIASTESGAFGACIKHAYLAGMHLDDAGFFMAKYERSELNPPDKARFRNADDHSKKALEERKLAEQSCRDYLATQLVSGPGKTRTLAATQRKHEVYFNMGSKELDADARARLAAVVEEIKQVPASEVMITGHADTTGSDNFNQALSTKRAVAVFEELKQQARTQNIALPPSRIEVVGAGEVSGPENVDNRADRRVEVYVVQPAHAQLER